MNEFAELWRYVEAVKPEIELALQQHSPRAPAVINTSFNDAVHYALFPGGKRLRPVLTLLGAEIVGGRREKVLPTAAAIEFVHTSSLIFDDLPCMDNAPARRGKTSLHQKYGEGAAVLVGLALLNASYNLVFTNADGDFDSAVRAHAELVSCIGESGMVGGQSVDLAMTMQDVCQENTEEFETLRNLKTSALIRMALSVGAIQSGASERQIAALTEFSEILGDAYQTSDDLLDLSEDLHVAQTNERRQTFALEQGLEKAKIRISNLVLEAKGILRAEFDSEKTPTKLLCSLTDYIAQRKT